MVRGRTLARFAQACAACAALVTLALGGCAPTVAPQGLENETPQITKNSLITRDGLSLPLREWDADKPVAVIVALHGMGDYSEAFDMPGPWWAEHGITTIAYDQRGFGRAPDPGIWGGQVAMEHDLDDCVEAAHAKFPGVPVYALGESMGGAVVLSALASDRPPRIAGAILAAPAVWSRDDMPVSYRVALWFSAHTLPWLHLSGGGLHIMPSDNIPMLRKLSRDPLMEHDNRVDQIYGLVDLMDTAHAAPPKLSDPPPILVLHGAKDQIIPPTPTHDVVVALGAHAEERTYPEGYHMLLRDLDRETVWKDIDDWIAAHAARTSEPPREQSPSVSQR